MEMYNHIKYGNQLLSYCIKLYIIIIITIIIIISSIIIIVFYNSVCKPRWQRVVRDYNSIWYSHVDRENARWRAAS